MKEKEFVRIENAIRHIQTAVDVDPWAIRVLKKVMDAYLADGCDRCAFEDVEEWELPCRICRRNCKDYWRAKAGQKTGEVDERRP